METRAHYTLIGAFTLTVIAAAFSFVFWFSGADKSNPRKKYQLVFSSSVSGLARGSWVLFNGLRVGEVTKIDLGEDPAKVNALIEIDPRTPVKQDTKARLEYQGLTGVASVALTGGTADAPTVERADGEEFPVIAAERSEFQNIVETVQNLSGKVDNLLVRVDTLLADNSGSITATMRNFERFSGGLAESSGDVKGMLASFAKIARDAEPFIATLKDNSGNIDATLRDTRDLVAKLSTSANKIDGVLASAQNALNGEGEIGEAVKSIRKLADNLDARTRELTASAQNLLGGEGKRGLSDDVGDAAKSIRRLADNLDVRTKEITIGVNRVTGPALRQYEALAGDARRALDEVNRAVRSLEKNPQQLIFGAKPQVPEYSAR